MKKVLILISIFVLTLACSINSKVYALDYANGKFETIYSEDDIKNDPEKAKDGKVVLFNEEFKKYSVISPIALYEKDKNKTTYVYREKKLHLPQKLKDGRLIHYDIKEETRMVPNVLGHIVPKSFLRLRILIGKTGKREDLKEVVSIPFAYSITTYKKPILTEDDRLAILIIDNNEYDEIWEYNPNTNKLRKIGSLKVPRYELGLQYLKDDKLLIYGGKNPTKGFFDTPPEYSLEIFDLKTNTSTFIKRYRDYKKYVKNAYRYGTYLLEDGRIIFSYEYLTFNQGIGVFEYIYQLFTPKDFKEKQ